MSTPAVHPHQENRPGYAAMPYQHTNLLTQVHIRQEVNLMAQKTLSTRSCSLVMHEQHEFAAIASAAINSVIA